MQHMNLIISADISSYISNVAVTAKWVAISTITHELNHITMAAFKHTSTHHFNNHVTGEPQLAKLNKRNALYMCIYLVSYYLNSITKH